jgi:hypothetical protein
MKLILESMIKNPNGVFDISVFIQNQHEIVPKSYTYHLDSEYWARKFSELYHVGIKCHGKALQILKTHKIEG